MVLLCRESKVCEENTRVIIGNDAAIEGGGFDLTRMLPMNQCFGRNLQLRNVIAWRNVEREIL